MTPSVLYDPITLDAIVLLLKILMFIMVIRHYDTIQETQKKTASRKIND